MKKLLFLFLVFLGICITTEMFAQWKPLADMTDAEIAKISDVEMEKRVINEWGGILTFLVYGVKMNDRIVEFFAQNFKQGALKWINKENWVAVDYVTAEKLLISYSWYCGSWYDTVWKIDKLQPPISLNVAVDRMMRATEIVYMKIQIGGITTTPPVYFNLKSKFDFLE